MGEQLGEGIWREMKLLLVSLDFNVPGFGYPGSPALMLMGGGARIYFCALCPLGGIGGRNTSDSGGCELSSTAQAPGCLAPVLETCSSEGEGKGFPLLVLEYHREQGLLFLRSFSGCGLAGVGRILCSPPLTGG